MKSSTKLLTTLALITLSTQVLIKPSYSQNNTQKTPIDLSKVTCREVLKMTADDKDLTFIFFHGLITGQKKEMMVDVAALTEATTKITDYCIDNPKSSLMSAFEKYR